MGKRRAKGIARVFKTQRQSPVLWRSLKTLLSRCRQDVFAWGTLSRAVFKSDLVKQYKVRNLTGNLRVNMQNLARRIKTYGFWSRASALRFPGLFCGIK